MNSWILILILLFYLGLLFFTAHWAEKHKNARLTNNGVIYSLSLAVYCTAWTYYGSIGVAATSGLNYLPIYIGPIIVAPLWIIILRKIIRISKRNNISSIADFISLRYGNSRTVGALVSGIIIIGILPYIALQLKAISETFHLVTDTPLSKNFLTDSTTYVSIALALFASYYGTRYVDASEKRSGIITAVALESILKLVFFVIIGLFVTYGVFNGFSDITEKASKLPDFYEKNTIGGVPQALNWFLLIMLSMFAIFLLPRQFQTMVVENNREKHLKTATWLFPLYLLMFNLFVFPIAWGGNLLFEGSNANPDMYSLLIPKSMGYNFLTVLVFLGGFSASISMIVISSISLSTMLSNNILIPYSFIGRFKRKDENNNAKNIVNIRKIGIFTLIILAFLLYKLFALDYNLVSIGLISFAIIAQLAPAFFGALFWRRGSKKGMITGLVAGFLICIYTLLFPYGMGDNPINTQWINNGPFGLEWLKPFALFGLDYLEPIPHALFWSLLANTLLYLTVSVSFAGNYRERNYAEMYVDIDQYNNNVEDVYVWRGTAYRKDIEKVLVKFLGEERTQRAMNIFNKKYHIDSNQELADARLVKFSENLLTGRIGTASAKILISSVVKEEKVTLTEVLKILEESKENIDINKKLIETSRELKSISDQLKSANQELLIKDKYKDEFLDTVTHELRTPITAIRASSELLMEDAEMPVDMKKQFLENIISESDRLNRLIDKILDLEKFDSGQQKLNIEWCDLSQLIKSAMDPLKQLFQNKNIKLHFYDTPLAPIACDHDRITQVVTNIVSNAIKFCPEVGGQIEILIEENENDATVCISDNGIGISENELDRVFDKFYQSENQTTKKPVGSGLGLAICKKIIEHHQGRIWVAKHKGAAFYFTLPKNTTA